MLPVILGCAGLALSPEERRIFADLDPFGFILFARNVESSEQLRHLSEDLRACTGRPETPIFSDEEGGRVARLRGPAWPPLPAMGKIGALYEQDNASGLEAMRLHATLTASKLRASGIDGNCAPVLDLHYDGASLVMGDRTFGSQTANIIALGRMAIETYKQNGIYPVIKHLPGHGRVMVDPHQLLPFVDATMADLRAAEFIPFQALRAAPMGMTCHVIFRAIDPDLPVSLSPKTHHDVIRGEIGFDGLLLSDDLAMGAVSHVPLSERGPQALAAGTDITIYSTGNLQETIDFCLDMPQMSDQAMTRWQVAQSGLLKTPPECDETALYERLKTLIPA